MVSVGVKCQAGSKQRIDKGEGHHADDYVDIVELIAWRRVMGRDIGHACGQPAIETPVKQVNRSSYHPTPEQPYQDVAGKVYI